MGPAQADVSLPTGASRKVRDSSSPRLLPFPALFFTLAVISLVIYKCCGSPPLPTCHFPQSWLSEYSTSGLVGSLPPDVNSTTCLQWAALHPINHQELSKHLDMAYNSEDFKQTAIQALGDAIRVP
jgi:Gly-Xaa carboxypeptidase